MIEARRRARWRPSLVFFRTTIRVPCPHVSASAMPSGAAWPGARMSRMHRLEREQNARPTVANCEIVGQVASCMVTIQRNAVADAHRGRRRRDADRARHPVFRRGPCLRAGAGRRHGPGDRGAPGVRCRHQRRANGRHGRARAARPGQAEPSGAAVHPHHRGGRDRPGRRRHQARRVRVRGQAVRRGRAAQDRDRRPRGAEAPERVRPAIAPARGLARSVSWAPGPR